MSLITRLTTAAALAAALALPAHAADERTNPETLYFGILATENSTAQREKWGPFLEDLQASLGIPVEPFF
ncbi:MAG: phosphonate ABC transporter substrate-binding protein, partial [Pseudomonadota bacterium]